LILGLYFFQQPLDDHQENKIRISRSLNMAEWKILISDGLEILRTAAQVDEHHGLTQEDLLALVGRYDGLIVHSPTKVTADVFTAAERLKVVGRVGVGVDNIDLAAAQAKGVTVVNTPQSTTLAVAEHTLALMFSLARLIPQADAAMKSGQWTKQEYAGVELNGKTLGLIGVGNIGSVVGKQAASLGMTVLGYDIARSEEEIQQGGAIPVTLAELYKRADIISLHVPLTPVTRGLINGQALGHMKRGVRLICTARGGLIDETALLAALESGQVAGAALDVYAKEPPGLTALVAHPRVIATPHISAQTEETQARAAVDIATEVLAALRGETLRWKIV
jgi:D-3-phosphoglycerate dehydrogenase